MTDEPITTLWRPVGPVELSLLEESGWSAWPPRLPSQPIFYPVLNRAYWIPAEHLDRLNDNIVGTIRVVDRFPTPR